MLGFARNIVFFSGKRSFRCGEELSRVRGGCGVAALPPNPARFARAVELTVPGDFFSSLLLLRFCVLHVLRYLVHWNWCIKAMCSTVVCCNLLCCVIQAASRFLAAADACGILLCFAVESHKLYCSGCRKELRMVPWQQIFLHFGADISC